jgi:hypothetical protein
MKNDLLASCLLGILCCSKSFAQGEVQKSADEIAQELSNPVGSLASLIIQGNYVKWNGSYPGISEQNTSTITVLPTIPVPLKKGNLIFRPILPFSAGLRLDENGEWNKERGLGDIGLIAMYGYNFKSGIVLGGGPNILFPTASKASLGSEQFQIGPSMVFAVIKKWGVLGGLWNHYFGIGTDEGEEAVNFGSLQPFYWFGIGNGWQIGGSPTMTANYVGAIDTDYSIPVNLGVGKTVILGKMPLKFTLQGQYYLTRADLAGANWGVFFQITPVIKLPW